MIYIKISFPAPVLCIYQPIFFKLCIMFKSGSSGLGLKKGKFYQYIQSYGPSFMSSKVLNQMCELMKTSF